MTVDGSPVRLTPTEYSILLYLVEHRGSVVAVEGLFRAVWNEDFYAWLQQYGDGATFATCAERSATTHKSHALSKRLGRRLHHRITLFAWRDLLI